MVVLLAVIFIIIYYYWNMGDKNKPINNKRKYNK